MRISFLPVLVKKLHFGLKHFRAVLLLVINICLNPEHIMYLAMILLEAKRWANY